jgi:hypothetical protein
VTDYTACHRKYIFRVGQPHIIEQREGGSRVSVLDDFQAEFYGRVVVKRDTIKYAMGSAGDDTFSANRDGEPSGDGR